ncbi:hypothetical protein EVAR_80544_1 [Eumeta japonica]|uniref:Mos1 transposase HTH domain-containing protein n=1 Tax=Eumeta variegata TaxID=151549 RepID=A0A4C1TMQ0_EUMVA|nr:hypothetical protein EVAR_80544_1 [Eumeta japonica]
MDLTHENFHAMIYYDFRRGLTQKQCIDRLTSAFENEPPSKITVGLSERDIQSDESWIYAYEPKTKLQPTAWVFQDESNPTKVIRTKAL